MLPKVKVFFEGTGLIKMRQRFLAGGMCEGLVGSNTQQGKQPGFVLLFHALYCG
jgi:hypothetical protein